MSKEINRLVIDTNLWISLALGSRKVAEKLIPIISSDYIRVFTSIELLDEITETRSLDYKFILHRKELKQYLIYY